MNAAPLYLGNVSNDFSIDDLKKTSLWHVYDFSVDYDCITVDDILDIHRYVMKKHDIKYVSINLESSYCIIEF